MTYTAALVGPWPRMQYLTIHVLKVKYFPSKIYVFISNAFFIFFIKTSSFSMFCASLVLFWPTEAYCYMNYLCNCLCRRNIYSNKEPGNRIYCSICPPMTLFEVMMMTVINWSWLPTTDKTCLGLVLHTAGPPNFQLDHCYVTCVIKYYSKLCQMPESAVSSSMLRNIHGNIPHSTMLHLAVTLHLL